MKYKAVIVAALFSLVLSGCQNDTDEPGDTTQGATTQNQETTAQRPSQEETTSPGVVVTEETTEVEVTQYSDETLPPTGGVKL